MAVKQGGTAEFAVSIASIFVPVTFVLPGRRCFFVSPFVFVTII